MTARIDASDINKHPNVIKKAQEAITKMDVLVCGRCHSVFHFVNQMVEHKGTCKTEAPPKDNKDTKPKVWAFQLWKAAQPISGTVNMWRMYQDWVKLEESQREAWIVAGRTLQTFTRMGQGSLQEAHIAKAVVDIKSPATTPVGTPSPTINRLTRRGIDVRQIKKEDEDTNTDEDASPVKGVRKPGTPAAAASPSLSPNKTVLARRTMSSNGTHIQVKELPVQQIIGKRTNARKRAEFLVKWVGARADTWEPLAHLDKCGDLIAEFEKTVAAQKAAAAAKEASVASPAVENTRPVRNSKVKALDQVKQWCTSGDEATNELKRKIAQAVQDSEAGAGDSSQDEQSSTPTPRKQMRTENVVQQALIKSSASPNMRLLNSGASRLTQSLQVRSTVPVNGSASPRNSAEVVFASANDKTTGVMRKPGTILSSPVKKEAQIKVVGKNETTSSGIVRIGVNNSGSSAAVASGGVGTPKTVPKLIHSSASKPGIIKSTPSPINRAQQVISRPMGSAGGIVRNQMGQAQARSPYQVKSALSPVKGGAGTPQQRVIRSGVGQPPQARAGTGPQILRRSVVAPKQQVVSPPSPSPPMTLCPYTGKIIGKEESDKEEEQQQQAQEAQQQVAMQVAAEDGQIQQLITNEDGSPVLVTGDDGTIYQIAGKNAEGQTLLIAQDGEGDQCFYVAGDELTQAVAQQQDGGAGVEQEAPVAAADAAAVAAAAQQQQQQQLVIDTDSQDGQITAELVQADEPSPGGTRRVVLLLPDGNLMVTEVNDEQYQQFNLGA